MQMTVINKEINVNTIRVLGVSSSSVLMVGDTNEIRLFSLSESPPEESVTPETAAPPKKA
ncbi:spore gernimation protein GerPD [Paenibacillus thiaminolyticus]|jgi:spore germination protein PD|nr:spore gernimation protein GerPD [Paenibacillus thiaminolyticus]WCF05840.1 spore gernimation protein GerPD [Paenibacillus thiaminolyticus]